MRTVETSNTAARATTSRRSSTARVSVRALRTTGLQCLLSMSCGGMIIQRGKQSLVGMTVRYAVLWKGLQFSCQSRPTPPYSRIAFGLKFLPITKLPAAETWRDFLYACVASQSLTARQVARVGVPPAATLCTVAGDTPISLAALRTDSPRLFIMAVRRLAIGRSSGVFMMPH